VLGAIARGAQALGSPGFVSKTFLSFYAVLLCEVLAAVPRVSEDLLTLLLPALAAGLGAGAAKEYRGATCMVLAQLLRRAQLAHDFLAGACAPWARAWGCVCVCVCVCVLGGGGVPETAGGALLAPAAGVCACHASASLLVPMTRHDSVTGSSPAVAAVGAHFSLYSLRHPPQQHLVCACVCVCARARVCVCHMHVQQPHGQSTAAALPWCHAAPHRHTPPHTATHRHTPPHTATHRPRPALAVVCMEVVRSWEELGPPTTLMLLAHTAASQPHLASLPLQALMVRTARGKGGRGVPGCGAVCVVESCMGGPGAAFSRAQPGCCIGRPALRALRGAQLPPWAHIRAQQHPDSEAAGRVRWDSRAGPNC
jgi:hypothetical protein